MKLLIVGETGCQNSIDECIHYLPRKCPKRKYEKIVMHAKFLSKYQWKVPLSELKVCLLVGASVNIWFAELIFNDRLKILLNETEFNINYI
jgi:hypothetical protein